MKPIALPLLAFILGLGIWIIATGSQDMFSNFTSSSDSNDEIVINDNNMEISPSDDTELSNDKDLTETEITNNETDKENFDEALLLAENSTSETSEEKEDLVYDGLREEAGGQGSRGDKGENLMTLTSDLENLAKKLFQQTLIILVI